MIEVEVEESEVEESESTLPLYLVGLHTSCAVKIRAEDPVRAKELVEWYVGSFSDNSTHAERESDNFEIEDIAVTEHCALFESSEEEGRW